MQKTALIFAGQGAQTVGMGKDLAQQFPTAARIVGETSEILGHDLGKICFEGPELELTKTEHAQPGIYMVSWLTLQLLKEACPGFAFQAAAGLSLGEFTALAAAGTMSFSDGLRIVHARGRAMQSACDRTEGTMAAIIGLDEKATHAVCDETGVFLANLNCPGQIVISGPKGCMDRACELARSRGAKRALPLTVAGAYHSPLMASAEGALAEALDHVALKEPSVPVISNVTGKPHTSVKEIRRHLVEQVTAPVRWEDSIRFLIGEGFTRFIELGPGSALSGFLKRIDKQVQSLNIADVKSLESTIKALGA